MNCSTCDNGYNYTCLTCPNGRYFVNSSGYRYCYACDPTCTTCTDLTSCYSCANGYYLPDNIGPA